MKVRPFNENQLKTIVAQHESEETTELLGSNNPVHDHKGRMMGERSPLQN